MADFDAIHEEIREIRNDASRDVREPLTSVEQALSEIRASDAEPKADRLQEIRAELDRLASETTGETSARLDRVREAVRDFQREAV
ncbi:DUF7553 family protein [Halorussus halophilus]|uniref:DUF7553 family protein n=1 Tax=Halorussus halophilus TaxID=2650975 RepID=UPI00130180C6|nr:hypothetical protein [Halorussus halophilus]